MPPIRTLITPNDFGPPTVTRTRLSRSGLGARLIVRGNPFSFTADWLTPCVPFLSLAGGRSPASQAARTNALGNLANDPGSGSLLEEVTPAGPAATAPAAPAAPAASGGSQVTPGTSGAFGYISAAHPTRST